MGTSPCRRRSTDNDDTKTHRTERVDDTMTTHTHVRTSGRSALRFTLAGALFGAIPACAMSSEAPRVEVTGATSEALTYNATTGQFEETDFKRQLQRGNDKRYAFRVSSGTDVSV